jgi:hypothetical protein
MTRSVDAGHVRDRLRAGDLNEAKVADQRAVAVGVQIFRLSSPFRPYGGRVGQLSKWSALPAQAAG